MLQAAEDEEWGERTRGAHGTDRWMDGSTWKAHSSIRGVFEQSRARRAKESRTQIQPLCFVPMFYRANSPLLITFAKEIILHSSPTILRAKFFFCSFPFRFSVGKEVHT